MAANAFYLALKMGDNNNIGLVQATSSSNQGPAAGTAAEVELRIMTDSGTGANGITKKQVSEMLIVLREFIDGNGLNGLGQNLPAL